MKRIIAASLSALLSSAIFAGTMGPDDDSDPCWGNSESCYNSAPEIPDYPWRRAVAFSIGPAWSNNGTTQTFYLQSDIEKTYLSTYQTNVFPFGELFLGLHKQISPKLLGQIGLAIAGGGEAKLQGEILEDADPNFNNYKYTYAITEARLTAKGKLLLDLGLYNTLPYVSAALGLGLNYAHSFNITADIYEEVPAPLFESNTTTAFTYAFGTGVHILLDEQWQAGIGYEFADWGKSQLSAAPGQTINQGLKLNNTYINSLLFSITYVS